MGVLLRFLNWLINYWIMLNYVFFRFYDKREGKGELSSMIYAPGWIIWNIITIFFVFVSIDNCFDFNMSIYRYLLIGVSLCAIIINYLTLYRKEKFRSVFKELIDRNETKEFNRKYRNTVIYIWVSVALLVLSAVCGTLLREYVYK